MKWIVDTDAGVDDAIAIAMPFATQTGQSNPSIYKSFELAAITCVAGNVILDKVLVNVGALLELLELPQVPFYKGCDRPMVITHAHAEEFHGADGLGDGGLSITQRVPEAEHAAQAIVRLAKQHEGDLSILALGPLTNIALACNLDPQLPRRLKQLLIMGGAWQARGNQSPTAEFNFAIDPESAHMVFERFDQPNAITLLPWEVSIDQLWPFERIATLAARNTRRGDFLGCMCGKIVPKLRDMFHHEGFPAPDPLTMCVALDPSVIATEVLAKVSIDISNGVGRGMSALQRRRATLNTRVVTSVHAERAFALIEAGWM